MFLPQSIRFRRGFAFVLAANFLLARQPSHAFLPLSSRQRSCAPTIFRHSEPPRNGKTEPFVQSGRDTLVQELQSEIASLYAKIAEQKDNYQMTVQTLQTDAVRRVEEAQKQLDSVKDEYENYKVEIRRKLENAATPAEMARLKQEVERSEDRAEMFKNKLDAALSQLRQNREDRKNLMGEMVALKESYIDKLNELEDQLEFVQDERVRDQQDGARRMTEMEEESKKRLKDAIEGGRKQVDELTLVYTNRIAVKEEELAEARAALGQARQSVQQKEEVIEQLETEAKSIRKLLGKSITLAKGRVSRRLLSLVPGKRQQEDH